MLTQDRLDDLTAQYGGEYNLNHAKRLLKIISIIGANYSYNQQVVSLAAYLHDWGAYPPWAIDKVDHAQRSVEVAVEFLAAENIDKSDIAQIAECIKYHHIGDTGKSLEAKLISDADGIDFIGTIGVIRIFSTRPRELRKAVAAAKSRMETVVKNICLEESKTMVDERINRMKLLLEQFEEESFGIY